MKEALGKVRWEILIGAMLVAGAIYYHGLADRYSLEVAPGGPQFRLNKQTGEIWMCRFDYGCKILQPAGEASDEMFFEYIERPQQSSSAAQ